LHAIWKQEIRLQISSDYLIEGDYMEHKISEAEWAGCVIMRPI